MDWSAAKGFVVTTQQRNLIGWFAVNTSSHLATSLFIATYTTFLANAGLTAWEMNTVNTAFMVSNVMLELPTGLFGDVYGHKRSMLLGILIMGIGTIYYGFSNSFLQFCVAELLAATGRCFISGSEDALAKSYLTKKTRDFSKIMSWSETIGRAIGIGGGFIGALIGAATGSLSTVWFVSGVLFLISFVIGLAFLPPEHFQKQSFKQALISTIMFSRKGMSVLLHKRLRNVVLASLIFTGTVQAANMFWARLVESSYGLVAAGGIASGINVALMAGGICSLIFLRFGLSKTGQVRSAMLLSLVTLSFAGIAYSSGSPFLFVVLFLLHEPSRGLLKPLMKSMVGIYCRMQYRDVTATTLSLYTLCNFFGAAVGLQISGFIANSIGMPLTIALSLPFGFVAVLLLMKSNRR